MAPPAARAAPPLLLSAPSNRYLPTAALGCVGHTLWEFGEVWCFVYPLLEVDTQFEQKNDHLPSVLRTLVEHKRLHHLTVRQIRSLIRDKWRRAMHLVFMVQLVAFIVALVFLTCCFITPLHSTVEQMAPYYWALIGSTAFLSLTFLPPPHTMLSRAAHALHCGNGFNARILCFRSIRVSLLQLARHTELFSEGVPLGCELCLAGLGLGQPAARAVCECECECACGCGCEG